MSGRSSTLAQVASHDDSQVESHLKSMLQCQEADELDDALTKVTSTMHGIASELSYSGLYITFLSGGGRAKFSAEVGNMATLWSFTLGGFGGGCSPGNFGHSEVHSAAIWCNLRHTEKHTELLEGRVIIVLLIGC